LSHDSISFQNVSSGLTADQLCDVGWNLICYMVLSANHESNYKYIRQNIMHMTKDNSEAAAIPAWLPLPQRRVKLHPFLDGPKRIPGFPGEAGCSVPEGRIEFR
jgi:hypothetical protein